MLTKRAIELLKQMKVAEEAGEHEEAEIVCEGFVCYLGVDGISYRTVSNLLLHCCVSESSDEGSGLRRFHINGTGRASIDDPRVAERVRLALTLNKPVNELGFELAPPEV